MSGQRLARSKRSSFILNLLETPQGFSLVQGTELLNRPEGNVPSAPPVPTHNPPKDYKPVFKKTNLIFLRGKTQNDSQKQLKNKNNQLMPNEAKQIASWLAQKRGISVEEAQQRQQFFNWISEYAKHKEFIVNLHQKQYASTQKYLSASVIRRYLCCDAFWVMKVHTFLTGLGLINANALGSIEQNANQHLFTTKLDGSKELITLQKQYVQLSQGEALRKATISIRPFCDYCRIQCGVVWFQHSRSLDPKQVANIMKNVNSKNPPLSQKQYEYILCVRCYCEDNFPLLLTHQDFKKTTINDRLQPNKKLRKNKKKKNKRKNEQNEQQQNIKQNGKDSKNKDVQQKSEADQQQQNERRQQINASINKLISNLPGNKWSLKQINILLDLVEKNGQDWVSSFEKLKKSGVAKQSELQDIVFQFLMIPKKIQSCIQQEYDQQKFVQQNQLKMGNGSGSRLNQYVLNESVLFFNSKQPQSIKKLLSKVKNIQQNEWKKKLDNYTQLIITRLNKKLNFIQQCQNFIKDKLQ